MAHDKCKSDLVLDLLCCSPYRSPHTRGDGTSHMTEKFVSFLANMAKDLNCQKYEDESSLLFRVRVRVRVRVSPREKILRGWCSGPERTGILNIHELACAYPCCNARQLLCFKDPVE
jgi:hypothetical protein